MGTSQSKTHEQMRWNSPFDAKRTRCDASLPPPPPPIPGGGESVDKESSGGAAAAPPPPPPDSIAEAAQFVSSIPNPGPYEQASMDAKRLVQVDTFDGFRFDINRQLSPYMAVIHSFWLGTSMLPDGRNKTYTFMTQVANETGLLLARVDFERGTVDGRIHQALLGGLGMGKLQIGVSSAAEGQNDQCMAEVDLNGMTWSANVKYGSAGGGLLYGINYFQSITPRLAMGGEGLYLSYNQALASNYTIRYTMPAKSGEDDKSNNEEKAQSLTMDSPSSTIVANYNAGQGAVTLNYKRLVTTNRVALGAELQFSPATLDSNVLVGAEFKLTRSKVALCVDGNGKIQTNVEAKLGRIGAPTIQFSADVDHFKDLMRFGYGINMEG